MMSDLTDSFVTQLADFDISQDEARVFLYASKNEPISALNISRDLKLPRTRVYRIVDKLKNKGLLVEVKGEQGARFRAASAESLDLLVLEKEREVAAMRSSVPKLVSYLQELQKGLSRNSEVNYYKGIEGLKQITWNSLSAKRELRIFEINDMSAFLDYGFAEKVRQEFLVRQIVIKELTGQRTIPEWTRNALFVQNFWEIRYVDPRELRIDFEILIYDNTLAMYGYQEKEIFGVEIINPVLAQMQMQMFDFVWKRSQVMEKTSKYGAARLKEK